jgi:hypothetical protein
MPVALSITSACGLIEMIIHSKNQIIRLRLPLVLSFCVFLLCLLSLLSTMMGSTVEG